MVLLCARNEEPHLCLGIVATFDSNQTKHTRSVYKHCVFKVIITLLIVYNIYALASVLCLFSANLFLDSPRSKVLHVAFIIHSMRLPNKLKTNHIILG